MSLRKSWGSVANSLAADKPMAGVGALSCGTSAGAPSGSKIAPVESMYRPPTAPMGNRGVTEIVTELENQFRETSP